NGRAPGGRRGGRPPQRRAGTVHGLTRRTGSGRSSATMSSTIVWYTARAAGIVAWSLAGASVLWGLAISTRALKGRPRPAWLFDLHRFLGGIAVAFTAIHVGAILLDTYVHFSLVNVVVPFTGTWHSAAVAWGIVAIYVLVAVDLTS